MAVEGYQPKYCNSWAVVVGINEYRYVSPLSYACNDAEAVASVLTGELGFPTDRLFLLKDAAATKQSILDTYIGLSEKANNPDDRVLFFFAGHGTTAQGSRGPIGYLVPVDGNPDSKNTMVRWDDLTRNAELLPAKHILFIMDACYSGLAIQRAIAPGTERFLSDMLQRFSRQVITAGKADQSVSDGGGPQGRNSIFTGYLLQGLAGEASDSNGILTANGLMAYVYQKVGQDSRSQQTPHYGHLEGDGDFVLRTPNNEHLSGTTEADYLVQTQVEAPEEFSSPIVPATRPTFAVRNGYGDSTHPNFGRNEWSNRLGEVRFDQQWNRETSKAFSWLSLILEPVANQPVSVDVGREFDGFLRYNSQSDKPHERFAVPRQGFTTLNSIIMYEDLEPRSEFWGRYLRVERSGNLEYADCLHVFFEQNGKRQFKYVSLIASIWQFLFFGKSLLLRLGFVPSTRLLVNLVGTKESELTQFAKEPGDAGKTWRQPDDPLAFSGASFHCFDRNIQMEYFLNLAQLDQPESKRVILDIASKLGVAYNHRSSPRCFNYNTEEFPWRQFFSTRY